MTALNPQIVGQAENAHRAILTRALTGTDLTYETYVALKIASAGPLATVAFIGTIAGALKVDLAAADDVVTQLTVAGLITADSALTEPGRELLAGISAAVGRSISDAYADIPAEDLETAARVLTVITNRLSADLAAA